MRSLRKQHNLSTFFVQSIDIGPNPPSPAGSFHGLHQQIPTTPVEFLRAAEIGVFLFTCVVAQHQINHFHQTDRKPCEYLPFTGASPGNIYMFFVKLRLCIGYFFPHIIIESSGIKVIGKILKIRCRFLTFQIIPKHVKCLLQNGRNRPAPACHPLANRM